MNEVPPFFDLLLLIERDIPELDLYCEFASGSIFDLSSEVVVEFKIPKFWPAGAKRWFTQEVELMIRRLYQGKYIAASSDNPMDIDQATFHLTQCLNTINRLLHTRYYQL